MPDRRPFIAGNWKLWGTRAQTAEYCERLLTLLPDASRRPADVGLCVPFTALDTAVQALEGSGATFPQGQRLTEATWWPTLAVGDVDIPFGFVVGALVAVALLVVLRRTRFGFAVRVIADAPPAAHYAGIRTRRTLLAMILATIVILRPRQAGHAGAEHSDPTGNIQPPRL